MLSKEIHGQEWAVRGEKEVNPKELTLEGAEFSTYNPLLSRHFKAILDKYEATNIKEDSFKLDSLQAKTA